VLTKQERFYVALSGGSVPAVLKKSLVDVRRSIDFERWTVFFADERFVPADHEDSNFRANEGWLKEAGVPRDQIFAVNTSLPTPKEAAEAYESLIRQQVPKGFDLVLLGMGPDGHTCSLFPKHALLAEEKRLIAEIEDSPKPPPKRVTFTLPLLKQAQVVAFLVQGAAKQNALNQALAGGADPVPSFLVRGASETRFIIDKELQMKK